ncbi:Uncharacterised protein [uncultured archaeon]|nr:Uncharacterised protein [uncultured archaeon]
MWIRAYRQPNSVAQCETSGSCSLADIIESYIMTFNRGPIGPRDVTFVECSTISENGPWTLYKTTVTLTVESVSHEQADGEIRIHTREHALS